MSVRFLKSFAVNMGRLAVSAALVTALTGASLAAATNAGSDLRLAQASGTTRTTSTSATTQIAPARTQYWFTATREGDTIVLDGYVPDSVLLARLSQTFQVDTRNLELASGAPANFAPAVDFGLKLLSHLSDGRFSVRSTIITIKGTAATAAGYTAALALTNTGIPQGSILALGEIKAPPVSPFTWSAQKSEDGSIALSGFIPNEETRGALQAGIDKTGADTQTYASGEPTGFESSALVGLGLLDSLQSGSVAFDGTNWSLTGTAENLDKANAAFAASGLDSAGWTHNVSAPAAPAEQIAPAATSPYVWQAEKSDTGVISFSGFVPDDGFRRFIAARAGNVGEDTSEVGAGAPTGFVDDAVAGFAALSGLESGKFGYDGANWSLSGKAASEDVKANILKALTFATDTEKWNVAIAVPAVIAAPAAPYLWSVSKTADGALKFSGFVPTDGLKVFIPLRVGNAKITNALEVASGAPEGFAGDVVAALEALKLLDNGQVAFNGKTWSIKGDLVQDADRDSIVTALAGSQTKPDAWTIDVKPAASPVAEPKVEPAPAVTPKAEAKTNYTFTASKPEGGPIALSGSVPADATKSFFGVIAGEVPTSGLNVTSGAPDDFIASGTAGLRALATLQSGELAFDGKKWSLKGKAPTPEDQASALASIAALSGGKNWLTDIAGPPPIIACREKIAAFAAENTILFDPASSHLTDSSTAALTEVARILSSCPQAYIYVEGHTDSDGDDNLNLALSVARSEAVIAALAADGINPDHLYAAGYGESAPIADNKTSAGKKANRRIVFTLLDKPE